MVKLTALAAVLFVYYLFDPLSAGWMPQCVFHRVTGLECAGCGLQRMLHSLLHLDFSGALRGNALAFFSLPVVLWAVWIFRTRERHPRTFRLITSDRSIFVIVAVLSVWTLLRNIAGL